MLQLSPLRTWQGVFLLEAVWAFLLEVPHLNRVVTLDTPEDPQVGLPIWLLSKL